MHLDRFWNLLWKHLAGEATAAEIAELEALIKAHPDLSFPAQHLTDLWKVQPPTETTDSEAAFASLQASLVNREGSNEANFPERVDEPIRSGKFLLVTLIGLLVLCSIWMLWPLSANKGVAVESSQTAEISTLPASRTRVVLPDGSAVWLNAGSKITYPRPFGEKERSMTLVGEAYFDIVKSKIPFVIRTGGVQIRVLGTAFNVRSYPSENKIETSLVRGRVEVALDNHPDKKYILNPNEKLTLNTAPASAVKSRQKPLVPLAVLSTIHYLDSTTTAETSWVQNKLVFDDEPFADVVSKMEHWYDVRIRFQSESLKTERLTGVFEKQTVMEALEALQVSTPFRFSQKNNEIILTR